MRKVDIIIPVYEGYQETVACITSVLETVDTRWARLVVISDCSPNQSIIQYLETLSEMRPDIVLLSNEKNLGFVATVNRGMAYDVDKDIVLLNSDVAVSGDWLTRLREAAYRQNRVASITPFSNNATICSFPNFCEDNRLIFGMSVEEIDSQFARQFSTDDAFVLPTGVGCCMYMQRDCLNEVGYFDQKTFGHGYGEENDWCQRALRMGWLNLHLANCFVYHKGGASFGNQANARVDRAQHILDRKYPRYHADIQDFIAEDPAKFTRVKAWLTLFGARDVPKVLMISHKLGGGVQQHVEELAERFGDQALFLQMVPDKDGETVRICCFDGKHRLKDGIFFNVVKEYGKLVNLLRGVGIGRVHFHHTVGVPTRLWTLADDLNCSYDLTLHDYYLVNSNPTMTDKSARFVDEKNPDFDRECAGHYPLPEGLSGDQWRINQELMVHGAERVIFPSSDSYHRFKLFFSVENPVVAWHTGCAQYTPCPEPHWNFKGDRPLRVLVLGALSREKGADVLESVASALAMHRIEFHLLGYAYRALGSSVISHGPYDNTLAHDLIKDIDPDVVWFPALWPETYSYTLSIALHNGLPVVVPDIGAFAERIRARPLSVIASWEKTTAEWRDFWCDVLLEGFLPCQAEEVVTSYPLPEVDNDFYSSQYLQAVSVRSGDVTEQFLDDIRQNLYAETMALSRSERVLKVIWHFTRSSAVAKLVSLIPFSVQRSIKRLLSQRPMHDIVGR
jgi:GT2 family glycosyltransferase/glycosyltransferase involved in cell wall biosynthesis